MIHAEPAHRGAASAGESPIGSSLLARLRLKANTVTVRFSRAPKARWRYRSAAAASTGRDANIRRPRRPTAVSIPADQAPRQSTEPQSGKDRGSIGNLFGIALDQASLRWATAEGVTETVIAAVSLLHERSVEEIAGKLTPAELGDVTRLVSRCPSCYPPGAYDALKARRNLGAEKPAARTTARVQGRRRAHFPSGSKCPPWASYSP